MTNKVGRNAPCPCGSGKKFKKCHMGNAAPGSIGVLRTAYNIADGDDFIVRFMFQMSEIRSAAFPRDKRMEYDKSYTPVFQNLLEAKYAKERCTKLMADHTQSIRGGTDGLWHNNQIDIKNPIDDELNIFFKDFFIRGSIAINCLIKHAEDIGYNINFLFLDDEKKFKKGAKKFPIKEDDARFATLVNFIQQHKATWYAMFRNLRDKIEHEGFALPHVAYQLDDNGNVQIKLPQTANQSLDELLSVCWSNLTNLCEEVLVFILSQKIKDPIVIVEIPEAMRDKHMPVKYATRHKAFPQAHYSTS